MKKPDYLNEELHYKERARDLVSRMTVEECADQMIFNAKAVERLGVKEYNWWNEALHGAARSGMATVFPQAIGLAATFSEELLQKVAEVIAVEGRAKYNTFQKYEDYGIYKGLTFWSPNVNIFRDPRWGRGQETYGEDPYLTGRLGAAFVRGLQGEDPEHLKAAACAKHFAVHSGPESLRHEFNAEASAQDMEETYLPAFKDLVDAGVEGFMGAYNRTNGEPCCGSRTLMVDLLRNKWKFDGYFTSDCWAIADFHLHHKVTEAPVYSVALALQSGCQLNCGCTYEHLLEAFRQGLVTEEQIRNACTKLMETRIKLGMFDGHTPYDGIDYSVIDCDSHRRLNEEAARRSLVLLKNDGILPLDKKKLKNVAVIGPNANSVTPLNGNYHGTANQYHTVLEAVRAALPDARVNYSKGCHLYEYKLEDPGYAGDCLAEVKAQTDLADVVILVVGMDETIEGEEIIGKEGFSGDKQDLLLPETQRNLIRTVCSRNKPVILVNMTGSAIDFAYGCNANAIIQAWYPGAMGGKAVSDLLFGAYSPSGKLPVTFYRNDNSLPDFEDYSMDNRTYKFFREKPLYPFGFGLGYSEFAYGAMETDKAVFCAGEDVTVTLQVQNTGVWEAEEVVQCYLRDLESAERTPVHKLCGMRRISLKPGETQNVSFTVKADQFSVITREGEHIWESGKFTVFVGGCQPDAYSVSLYGKEPASLTVELVEK